MILLENGVTGRQATTQARAGGLEAHADCTMSNDRGIKATPGAKTEAVRPTAQTATTHDCN